jgi:hypothetical protein
MSLQNERGEPARRKWLSRFSRERLDLSASVEETLRNEPDTIEQDLLDPLDSGAYEASLQTSQHSKVIAPRLTIQSSPVPIVRALPPSQTGEGQKVDKGQKTGIFARFGRRGASSAAARSSEISPATAVPAPSLPQLPTTSASHLAASSPGQQRPADVASRESQVQAATKVNSRPTKVRLEVAPAAELREKKETASRAEHGNLAQMILPDSRHEGNVWAATSDMQSLDISASIPATPNPHSPILDFYRLDTYESSMRLPTMPVTEERSSVSRRVQETLSGSGIFEAGQRDVTLENTHVTAAAVVLVTLTSNPGPAVVQYVSLRPAAGFTIHLSSPATVKTSFNYVILLSELF